jgi:hypothetical protein
MRALLSATAIALALGVFLAADVMAKGEIVGGNVGNVNVTIGPIDELSAGTPTTVTAQITQSGQQTTEGVGAYLTFYEPVSKDQLEFSLNYDHAAGAYVTLVTLPHAGRWLVDAGTRFDTGSDVPYGGSDGTHVVTVVAAAPPPAPLPEPTAPAPPFLVAAFLAGVAAVAVAWLLGLQLSSLRRRRRTPIPAREPIGGYPSSSSGN